MLGMVNLETRVPADHPLRPVKQLVDQTLAELDPVFERMYAGGGRSSIPPERLLKALLLMALFSIRSERLFCEQLAYNMLFLWFLDMQLSEQPFDATTFTKNRQRFEEHDVLRRFFEVVVERARRDNLLSSDQFSVDGTLIEAWGSNKSFRPRDEEGYDPRAFAQFRGEKRSNETHESKTDPDSKLYRKGNGQPAKLSHMAHILVENDNGLVVDAEVTAATGTAEREAALTMLQRQMKRRAGRTAQKRARRKSPGSKKRRSRPSLAADKAYDTRDFIRQCRSLGVTPHVASKRRHSAVDRRTTRHAAYRQSQRARLLTEKVFGWTKAPGRCRRSRFRGRPATSQSILIAFTAHNIIRIAKLNASA